MPLKALVVADPLAGAGLAAPIPKLVGAAGCPSPSPALGAVDGAPNIVAAGAGLGAPNASAGEDPAPPEPCDG